MTEAGPEKQQAEAAPRVRRRLADPAVPAEEPGRKGCLRLAMVLGILAGVVVAVLVLPRALDYFFQPERVPVGQTFAFEGLELRVQSVEPVAGGGWLVRMQALSRGGWKATLSDFQLEFAGGARVRASGPGKPQPNAAGELVLAFPGAGAETPVRLLLANPQVEFALPAAAAAASQRPPP